MCAAGSSRAVERHADYLKAFEPIGVRDAATGQFLEALGIRTETTYCLTLTFPRRRACPCRGESVHRGCRGYRHPQEPAQGCDQDDAQHAAARARGDAALCPDAAGDVPGAGVAGHHHAAAHGAAVSRHGHPGGVLRLAEPTDARRSSRTSAGRSTSIACMRSRWAGACSAARSIRSTGRPRRSTCRRSRRGLRRPLRSACGGSAAGSRWRRVEAGRPQPDACSRRTEMLCAVGVLPCPGTDFANSWISLCPFHLRVIVWAGQ